MCKIPTNFLRFFLLSLVFLLTVNCEKEITEPVMEIAIDSNEFKFEQKTFNEYFLNPKFKKEFLETMAIKGVLGKGNTGKSAKDNIYNFTIDSSTVKQITLNKTTTFSMLIKRETTDSSFFENLALKIDSLGQTKAYLIKYTYTAKPTYNPDHDSKSFEGTVSVLVLDPNLIYDASGKTQYGCTDVYTPQCNGTLGNGCTGSWHVPGENCQCIVLKQTGLSCGYTDDGGFNLGEVGTTNTSGGGGGTNSNVVDEDSDQLVTVPVDCKECALPVFEDDVFDVETIAIKLELSIAEADFLIANQKILAEVANFLIENDNTQGENFARNAIKIYVEVEDFNNFVQEQNFDPFNSP